MGYVIVFYSTNVNIVVLISYVFINETYSNVLM